MIEIQDIECNIEAKIREDIRLHAGDNMYLEFQRKYKDVSISLHQSVLEEYDYKVGRYSPEVIVPSIDKS